MSNTNCETINLLDESEILKVTKVIKDRKNFLTRVELILKQRYHGYTCECFNNIGETPQVIENHEIRMILYGYGKDVLGLLERQCGETPKMIRVPFVILYQILNDVIIEQSTHMRLRPDSGAIEVSVETGKKKNSRNFRPDKLGEAQALIQALHFRSHAKNCRNKDKQKKRVREGKYTADEKKIIGNLMNQGFLSDDGEVIKISGIRVSKDPGSFEKRIYISAGRQKTDLLIDKEIPVKWQEPIIRDFKQTLLEAIDKLSEFLGLPCLPDNIKDFLVSRFGSQQLYS